MNAKTMTISIPASLREYVEYKADAKYGSVSKYIRDLIRNDRRRDLERMDEIAARPQSEFHRRPPFA